MKKWPLLISVLLLAAIAWAKQKTYEHTGKVVYVRMGPTYDYSATVDTGRGEVTTHCRIDDNSSYCTDRPYGLDLTITFEDGTYTHFASQNRYWTSCLAAECDPVNLLMRKAISAGEGVPLTFRYRLSKDGPMATYCVPFVIKGKQRETCYFK